MRLTALKPEWWAPDFDPITGPCTPRVIGVSFRCPCGSECENDRIHVAFEQPPDGGLPYAHHKTRWRIVSKLPLDFETLQLHPSIVTGKSDGFCKGWHGWVGQRIPGEVTSC